MHRCHFRVALKNVGHKSRYPTLNGKENISLVINYAMNENLSLNNMKLIGELRFNMSFLSLTPIYIILNKLWTHVVKFGYRTVELCGYSAYKDIRLRRVSRPSLVPIPVDLV